MSVIPATPFTQKILGIYSILEGVGLEQETLTSLVVEYLSDLQANFNKLKTIAYHVESKPWLKELNSCTSTTQKIAMLLNARQKLALLAGLPLIADSFIIPKARVSQEVGQGLQTLLKPVCLLSNHPELSPYPNEQLHRLSIRPKGTHLYFIYNKILYDLQLQANSSKTQLTGRILPRSKHNTLWDFHLATTRELLSSKPDLSNYVLSVLGSTTHLLEIPQLEEEAD